MLQSFAHPFQCVLHHHLSWLSSSRCFSHLGAFLSEFYCGLPGRFLCLKAFSLTPLSFRTSILSEESPIPLAQAFLFAGEGTLSSGVPGSRNSRALGNVCSSG